MGLGGTQLDIQLRITRQTANQQLAQIRFLQANVTDTALVPDVCIQHLIESENFSFQSENVVW